ncbi:hypothetical protein M2163_000300 [Streptomyces sp. SAI-135]|nr:hypothetical protein [Streptomyces sp. SAI-090]MDH6554807.1 hypothetical protein [Streptomyces sp. SAI-041]MDH6574079.1 hypothetical protein [Streptomyces sp. SAI-117]MDH6581185.1 hypothetical protein [Streptomyces sp. SAI-133]MDH6613192.1 hypothetical protein [Streptomyces sp. SAI-135]
MTTLLTQQRTEISAAQCQGDMTALRIRSGSRHCC